MSTSGTGGDDYRGEVAGEGWPSDFPDAAAGQETPNDQPTEPVVRPGVDEAAHHAASPAGQAGPRESGVDWEQEYGKERKRSRTFMATTAVAALLFTGTLAYAVAAPDLGGDDPTGVPGVVAPDEEIGGYEGYRGRHDRGGPGGGPRGSFGDEFSGDRPQQGVTGGYAGEGAAGEAGDYEDGDDPADEDYEDYEDYEDHGDE